MSYPCRIDPEVIYELPGRILRGNTLIPVNATYFRGFSYFAIFLSSIYSRIHNFTRSSKCRFIFLVMFIDFREMHTYLSTGLTNSRVGNFTKISESKNLASKTYLENRTQAGLSRQCLVDKINVLLTSGCLVNHWWLTYSCLTIFLVSSIVIQTANIFCLRVNNNNIRALVINIISYI